MEYYFQRYGDLELHRRMIGDRARTGAFARAIAEVVGGDDTVLDIGTGTGVLAMLAAKAGARMVHAVDQAEITQTAANLIKANGLTTKVRVLRGEAADVRLERPATVLISEWLGNFAFVESMLDDVLAARDHNLAEGGKMIPSHVEVCLAPIDDAVLYAHDGPGFWRDLRHDLDFSSLEELELKQGRVTQLRIDPAALLAAGRPLFRLDLATARSEDRWRKGKLTFEAKRDGVLNGFAGWFVAQLSPSVVLDTGPEQVETHWAQSWFPFPPRVVRKGARIEVAYETARDLHERRHVTLDLSVGKAKQRYRLE